MLVGLYDAELMETRLFMSKEPKWKEKIKTVLVRQLSPDRHELKTTYVNSFKLIENSKRTRNSNINSSEKTENSKNIT